MRILPALFFACLLAANANAASLSVSPVRADLSPQAPIASIGLSNSGSEPVVMEATVHAWTQDGSGKWHLSPTSAVLAYPPQVTIPAQGQSFVRIGLEDAAAAAYRLELRELVDHANLKAGAVRIITRISIPVFVPPAPQAQSTSARIQARFASGVLGVQVENTGNMPLTPQEWTVIVGTSKTALPGYVLPGGTFEWSTPLSACPSSGGLKLAWEGGSLSAPIQGCQ